MSLNSENSRVQYAGNGGAAKPYPVPFVFHANADLKVVVTNAGGVDVVLTEGSGYEVSGAGSEDGGYVVTTTAYDPGDRVTIYREVDATQETVYEENADFPAESHERALDKLTMLVQQLGRKVRSAFRTRESDGETPELTAKQSSLMGFDAAKYPRTMTAPEVAAWLNVSQQFFGQGSVTFLNAADRNAAVPQFLGQIGVQLDTLAIYTASGLTAGSWGTPISGIANGSIFTTMLADGLLSADSAGRAKMANGFVSLPKIGDGIFTADINGRRPFAAGFVDPSLCAADLWRALAPVGAVLQTGHSRYTSREGIPGRIPEDDTVPQITEGISILSVTLTPSSSASKFRVLFQGLVCDDVSSNTTTCVALFNGSSDALATVSAVSYAYYGFQAVIDFVDQPATTGPVTYSIRVGKASGNVYFNRRSASVDRYNNTMGATLVVQELKGA